MIVLIQTFHQQNLREYVLASPRRTSCYQNFDTKSKLVISQKSDEAKMKFGNFSDLGIAKTKNLDAVLLFVSPFFIPIPPFVTWQNLQAFRVVSFRAWRINKNQNVLLV